MSIKPSLKHRRIINIIFTFLWGTGAIYLLSRFFNNTLLNTNSPRNSLEFLMIKIHAAIGFITLILLGSLIEHINRAWPINKSRRSGVLIVFFLLILTISSWGLYYFGDDTLRNQTIFAHSLLGLLFPLIFLAHIKK